MGKNPAPPVACMTSLADRTITALRSTHDDLAALVRPSRTSNCPARRGRRTGRWRRCSRTSTSAEIAHAGYRAALDGTPPRAGVQPGGLGPLERPKPQDQAAQFLEHDAALLGTLEALTPEQRENLEIKPRLPEPLPLTSVVGMRLNEAAQHAWDVRVALDPAAIVDPTSAEVLLEHFTGGLGFLLGFIGKAEHLSEPTRVRIQDTDVVIAIDGVSLSPGHRRDGHLPGAPEAAIRAHRRPADGAVHPEGVEVTGNVTLDDLRRVFPGY